MESEKLSGGTKTEKKGLQERILRALYGNLWGRMLLRPLVSPWFSKFGGYFLDTRMSALLVKPFVKLHNIDLEVCEKQQFFSYNDFFTRKLKKNARVVAETGFPAPCDARLSVYSIEKNRSFFIKNTFYTVESLLQNKKLAARFEGGTLWLYRLSVEDYHRYIYLDDGEKSENVRIPGVFHTVHPLANDVYPIYKENTREYCLIKTKYFGTVLMMEVGAMLVGKIENREQNASKVRRGEEKGNFAFGGSTILVLTQKGKVEPQKRYFENTKQGIETKVKLGQRVSN